VASGSNGSRELPDHAATVETVETVRFTEVEMTPTLESLLSSDERHIITSLIR